MLKRMKDVPRVRSERLLPVKAVQRDSNGNFAAVYLDPKQYEPERVPVSCSSYYKPYAVIWMRNGCCRKEPVLITTNRTHDGRINYSGQCACDGWCTSGHNNPQDCVEEYRKMTERKDRHPEWY